MVSTGQSLPPGEFSRRSRLSPKALRLYEQHGLLAPDRVDPANGYRYYAPEQLRVARLIVSLRRLGMPVAEVAAVLAAEPIAAAEQVSAYWEAEEAGHRSRRALAAHVRVRLLGDEGIETMYDVTTREVPEQLVLTEQRHVLQHELVDWMGPAIGRMWEVAPRFGGVSGPVFVVFHGEVSEDSDGPVEVCAPIEPADPDAVDLPWRREPAHREAYTRLVKAQVAFPQILSAYDAVAAWAERQGETVTGAPREVYFTDFGSAGPDDEVTDIAFPIAAPQV